MSSPKENANQYSLDDLILQIKEAPLSSVVGHYLAITTRGHSKLALCPFHSDSHPSLNINDSKGLFKCFACNTAGDSISFVQKYKNLGFKQALEEIAGILGLDFHQFERQKKQNPKLLLAKKILTRASLLYKKLADGPEQESYKQFISSRGLTAEMASKFSLGIAVKGNTLVDYLKSIGDEGQRKEAIECALEIGIIKLSKDGKSYYDAFRERVMFPLWDHHGHVVGFTGRDLSGKSPAKYYNSHESLVFNKRSLLYGLHFARSYIRDRDQVIICEGNMDLISLHQNAFENSVAVMGVAMAPKNIQLLASMTQNFYLALDSDLAGLRASERINKDCMLQGQLPKYIDFAPAKDPDEFLQKFGTLELSKKLESAPYFIDHWLESLIPRPLPESLEDKLAILHRIFEALAPLKMDLRASERIIQKAMELGLRSAPESILAQYQEYLSKNPHQQAAPKSIELKNSDHSLEQHDHQDLPSSLSESIHSQKLPSPPLKEEIPLTKAERWLILSWVRWPQHFSQDKQLELLDLVHNPEVKRYLGRLRQLAFEVDDNEFKALALDVARKEDFGPQIQDSVGSEIWETQSANKADPKILQRLGVDLKRKLKEEKIVVMRKELRAKQSALPPEQEELKHQLMRQLAQLDGELAALKSPSSVNK